MQPLGPDVLPDGVRARFVDGVNGLRMHVLEAGDASRPCLLLLHGFPELAYSWRRVMPALADAGYHVVAPDQRGYGRTTGWSAAYDDDPAPFRLLAIARDALALVFALGHRDVAAVIGHDFGAPVAAWCALVRPDVFRAAVVMSAPFSGPPALPHAPSPPIAEALAALQRPRKHYQIYYTTRGADADMRAAPQGLHDFLRAYYHVKSADWPGNAPCPLASGGADELAKLPTYYVMDRDRTMPETVLPEMPSPDAVAACRWLPDRELAVYAAEFARTGFQGGLNWYRCGLDPRIASELSLFAGRRIEVPTLFAAGAADWGTYQTPGAIEAMRDRVCADFRGMRLIEGAGHWVQQEQPAAVLDAVLPFLDGLPRPS